MTPRHPAFLHESVSETLRQRIVSSELRVGVLLPGEHALAEEFGVSRSVIRQSLRTLSDEGLLRVAAGRGAVVAGAPAWHRNAQVSTGLSAQLCALGKRVTTAVLTCSPVSAGELASRLGSDTAVRLERVRSVDDVPVAYIRTWLPGWLEQHVSREILTDASLHATLRERADVVVQGGHRQILAVRAEDPMGQAVGVPHGSPLLLLEGESVDQHGRVVEIFSTWHRSDRIALDLTATPSLAADPAGPTPPPDTTPDVDSVEKAVLDLLDQVRRLKQTT